MSQFNPADHQSDAIPAGTYFAQLKSIERRTSNAGNVYLALEFTILNGQLKGRRVFDNMSLVDKALWRVSQLCAAVGHTSTFDLDVNQEIMDALGEKPFALRTKIEDYQGEKRTKVHSFNPATKEMFAGKAQEETDIPDDEIPF